MPWIISLKNAERRAREKGEAYELSSGWAREVWTGVCAVSGLRFVERPAGKRRGKRGLSLFSVSLDKKIPKLGYTKSNSRFVLYGINLFKNTGTDFEILKIARAIVQHAKNRNR